MVNKLFFIIAAIMFSAVSGYLVAIKLYIHAGLMAIATAAAVSSWFYLETENG